VFFCVFLLLALTFRSYSVSSSNFILFRVHKDVDRSSFFTHLYMVPWANPSLRPNRHVDRFIRFCIAHHRVSLLLYNAPLHFPHNCSFPLRFRHSAETHNNLLRISMYIISLQSVSHTSSLSSFLTLLFPSLCFVSHRLTCLLVYFLTYLSTTSRIDPFRFQAVRTLSSERYSIRRPTT